MQKKQAQKSLTRNPKQMVKDLLKFCLVSRTSNKLIPIIKMGSPSILRHCRSMTKQLVETFRLMIYVQNALYRITYFSSLATKTLRTPSS